MATKIKWAWVWTCPNSDPAKRAHTKAECKLRWDEMRWDVSLQHLIWKYQTTSETEQVMDDCVPVRQCAATNTCREPQEWSKAWFRWINKCLCWTPAAFHCVLLADFAGFLKKVHVLCYISENVTKQWTRWSLPTLILQEFHLKLHFTVRYLNKSQSSICPVLTLIFRVFPHVKVSKQTLNGHINLMDKSF